MTKRMLTITLQADWKGALRDAGRRARTGIARGVYQGEQLNFETPQAFFGRLTERRWALVRLLQEGGPAGVRELARRAGRDPKRVHGDASALIELGLIERDETGVYICPFADIHVDMHLQPTADQRAA